MCMCECTWLNRQYRTNKQASKRAHVENSISMCVHSFVHV